MDLKPTILKRSSILVRQLWLFSLLGAWGALAILTASIDVQDTSHAQSDERWIARFDRQMLELTTTRYGQNQHQAYRNAYEELISTARELTHVQRTLPLAALLWISRYEDSDVQTLEAALASLTALNDDANAKALARACKVMLDSLSHPLTVQTHATRFRKLRDLDTQFGAQLHPYVRLVLLLLVADAADLSLQTPQAIELTLRALSLTSALPPASYRVSYHFSLVIHRTLARLMADIREFKIAQDHLKALRAMIRAEDLKLYDVELLLDEAFLVSELGDKEATRAFYEQARHLAQDHNHQLLALTLANLAEEPIRQGRFQAALSYAELAFASKPNPDSIGFLAAKITSGQAKIGLGRIREGMAEIRAGIDADSTELGEGNKIVILNDTVDLLERVGAWRQAWETQGEFLTRSQRQTEESSIRGILESQEQYEQAQREAELEALSAQLTLQDQQRIQALAWKTSLQGLTAFTALGFLAGITLFRQLRYKRRLLLEARAQLARQADQDPLTRCANRHRLTRELAKRAPHTTWRGGLLLMDIDHFKRINDTYGHAAGDAVLVEIAERIRASVRATDLVVRLGGEEFLIIVDDANASETQALALRVLETVATQVIKINTEHAITVTTSIGYTHIPLEHGGLEGSWEQVIELIDSALYIAKQNGRNRAFGIHSLDHHYSPDELVRLSSSLTCAWKDGQVGMREVSPGSPRHAV